MSIERSRERPVPEAEGNARGAFLRRIETAEGRGRVIDEALDGRGGPLAQDFLDTGLRAQLVEASARTAAANGRQVEPMGQADAAALDRIVGRDSFLSQMGTVQGRDGIAVQMRMPADTRNAGLENNPIQQEWMRREAMLGTPEGREVQFGQAREYAARLNRGFQAVQPGEAILSAAGGGEPLPERAEMLRAMGTVQGRRDLMAEARASEFGRIDPYATSDERRGVLDSLRRPEGRAAAFGEAEALAKHEGRAFEPLARDAPLYAAEDRARGDVMRGLATPTGRDALMAESASILPRPVAGEVSEASSYQTEHNRLVRGLGREEFRNTLLDESARTQPGFEPLDADEKLGRKRQFEPGMGTMRSVELEIGGAPNMGRDQVAAMIGRIDDGLATESPRARMAALARQSLEL